MRGSIGVEPAAQQRLQPVPALLQRSRIAREGGGIARGIDDAGHLRSRKLRALHRRARARRIEQHGIEVVELGRGERIAKQIASLHRRAATTRASAGGFHSDDSLPVGFEQAELACAAIQQNRLDLYASVPAGGHSKRVTEADLTRKCALIIGSEGRGVSHKLRSAAMDLSIPTVGVESLNAAMAASILLYEAQRQRALRS